MQCNVTAQARCPPYSLCAEPPTSECAPSEDCRMAVGAIVPGRQRMAGLVRHFHMGVLAERAELAGRIDGEVHRLAGILIGSVVIAIMFNHPAVVVGAHDIFDAVHRRGFGFRRIVRSSHHLLPNWDSNSLPGWRLPYRNRPFCNDTMAKRRIDSDTVAKRRIDRGLNC